MKQGIKFTQDLGQMAWFLQVPWFDVTHIDKHTQDTEGLTQIYIYINNTCYMHTTATGIALNLLIPKISLQRSTMSLLSKIILSEKSCICWFDSPRVKSFLWNTENTDRDDVNEQNANTTHRKKDNFRKN